MSLASGWDAIQAGCISVPQHGYFHTEPLAKYRVTYGYGVNRAYWQFDHDVTLVFDCPSPPHTFRTYFHEKTTGGSSTDPILSVEGYLAVCGSPGSSLDTSKWFTMAILTLTWRFGATIVPDWVHLMNYGSSSGSIGLVRLGKPLP